MIIFAKIAPDLLTNHQDMREHTRSDLKTMKSKGFFWLMLMIVSLIIGMAFSQLIYTGIMQKWGLALREVPFYAYPLLFILAFYVTLFVHEMAHFLAFKIQGIKLRALYLTMFVWVKQHKKWRFKIRPKLWVLFGGLVVPDLPPIKDQASYQKVLSAFAKSLIAAPVATLVFAACVLLTSIGLIGWSNNIIWIGFFFIYMLFNTAWTALYYATFKLHTDSIYGDFVAFRNMKEDPVFALSQVVQYTMFSTTESQEADDFIMRLLEERIESLKINYTLFHHMLVIQYLEGLIEKGSVAPQTIHHKLISLAQHLPITNEQTWILGHQLVLYFYQVQAIEEASNLWLRLIKRTHVSKLPERLLEYYEKKTEHMTFMADHDAYFLEDEHLYVGQMWIFEPVINPFEHERKSIYRLEKHIWECHISHLLDGGEQKSD